MSFFDFARRNHATPLVILNRGGLTIKLATEEVTDVSVLFGNHGSSRRRGGFYRRASSIGRESFS